MVVFFPTMIFYIMYNLLCIFTMNAPKLSKHICYDCYLFVTHTVVFFYVMHVHSYMHI